MEVKTGTEPARRDGGSGHDETVMALRKEKKEAIRRFDFEAAKRIDREVESRHRESAEKTADSILEEFEGELADYMQRHESDFVTADEEFEVAVRKIRAKYDQIFKDLQRQHLKELANLEADYEERKSKTEQRPVAGQAKLLEQAKNVAMTGEYDKAVAIRDRARKMAQDEYAKRLGAVKEDFERARARLLEQQKPALVKLGGRLMGEIETTEKIREKKIAIMQNSRDVQLTGICQRGRGRIGQYTSAGGSNPQRILDEIDRRFAAFCSENDIPLPKGLTLNAKN
jgi:hypothetical protein